ncbi:MAG: RagB/SusD family nutrient uptake outer membrane protein [Sphingobacteriales bacterium]|nr:MAG: RagB/SusD family nutrient uptake outer membrane protein [Sphingobacteriales bacterium]
MKRITYSILSLAAIGVIGWSCSKSFLDKKPLGQLDANTLANKKGVEALLVGAYSVLDGFINGGGIFLGGWQSSGTNWVYGSVVGGDAHKGSDAGDQPDIIPIESFSSTPTNGYYEQKWAIVYEGVTRSNSALKQLAAATDVSEADRKRITAEARFLRGHYHFEAKKMWNNVPWIDETLVSLEEYNVANTTDIWPKITEDLKFAYDNLTATMPNKGRVNKWAAGAMYGKALLFQKKYAEARAVLRDVYTNGTTATGAKYALLTKFADNFNAETKNSTESVFAVQYSVNDGTSGGDNGGWGEVLNFPYTGGPGTCCGFFQPSQDLVNAFQVDAGGLPDLDNYNKREVKNDFGVAAGATYTVDNQPVDARLDWTVGRRGIPYLDWGLHPGVTWIRDQTYAGPYAPIKNTYYKTQQGVLTDKNFWTSGVTANNYTLIRFADVILMLAETEVEVGTLEEARRLVNQVRARAANPTGFVQGSAATYQVGLYTTPWTDKAVATKAVRFERRLELGMEGHRFFDLVRWGVAEPTLNTYLKYVSGRPTNGWTPPVNKRNFLVNANFTAGKNEYFPIPQNQIDRSSKDGTPVLKQNPGF